MFALLGAVLVLLGILGLLGLIGTGLVVEIILIVLGLALIAYDRGAFGRRVP
jgi:hypothetical protein